MDDYYKILGLNKNCNENDIKKAYYRLARENHPDKASESQKEEATKKFQKIGEANEVLSDPEKRKIYDIHGKDGLNGNMPSMNPFDIFSMFKNSFNSQNFHQNSNFKRKNKPTIFPLNISLKDVYTGIYKKLKVTKKVIVKKGTKNKIKDYEKTWEKCSICKGEGMINELKKINSNSYIQSQKPCNGCFGKCFTMLKDYEIIEISEILELNIPKGVPNEYNMTFSNQGNCLPGSLPGDLIVIIKSENKEKGFVRNGNNLMCEKKISLSDALCGVEFKITTLDERTIPISFSEVIIPGDKKTIPNEGINKGNLIIVFDIIFPTTIQSHKKGKLRKLLD
jgi:DnaJ homolog subfamily A member 2